MKPEEEEFLTISSCFLGLIVKSSGLEASSVQPLVWFCSIKSPQRLLPQHLDLNLQLNSWLYLSERHKKAHSCFLNAGRTLCLQSVKAWPRWENKQWGSSWIQLNNHADSRNWKLFLFHRFTDAKKSRYSVARLCSKAAQVSLMRRTSAGGSDEDTESIAVIGAVSCVHTESVVKNSFLSSDSDVWDRLW